MPKRGDVVEIAGRKIGEAAREGTVLAVTGSMLRIRWTSGEESSLIPGPGTMSVVGTGSPAAKKKSAPRKAAARKAAPKKAPAKKSAKKAAPRTAVKKKTAAKKATKKATKKKRR